MWSYGCKRDSDKGKQGKRDLRQVNHFNLILKSYFYLQGVTLSYFTKHY